MKRVFFELESFNRSIEIHSVEWSRRRKHAGPSAWLDRLTEASDVPGDRAG